MSPFFTALIAHITISMPYVIITILPKIKQIDPNILAAAIDLGCSPCTTFFKITLPNITPSIIQSLALAFATSFDDFTVSYFTTEGSFQTLPIVIYSMVKRRITPKINALFTIIFLFALFILVIVNVFDFNSSKNKISK